MSNEEIKAPEIEGFEQCDYDTWCNVLPKADGAHVVFQHATFYYKRIKPREKPFECIVDELFPEDIFIKEAREANVRLLNWIDENYVKKEG